MGQQVGPMKQPDQLERIKRLEKLLSDSQNENAQLRAVLVEAQRYAVKHSPLWFMLSGALEETS